MKKFVSLLFAFIFIFTLCACGAKDDGKTTTAQSDTTQTTATEKTTAIDTTTAPLDTTKITATEKTTKSQAEIDKIIDGIRKAAVLSSVLDKYGSCAVVTGFFDGFFNYRYFRKNGKIAYVVEGVFNGEPFYDGYYDGLYYSCKYNYQDHRMTVLFDLDEMCLDIDYSILEDFYTTETERIFDPDAFSCFNLINETKYSYFFSTDEEVTDIYSWASGIYEIDKKTMLPVRERFDDHDHFYEFEYGFDVEELNEQIDAWQGKLRKVTVVKEYVKYGELVTEEVTVEIPATWELDLRYYHHPFYINYMDAAHTVEYSYPGDGVDYTVYASQIYDGLID